jgi:hypothetical protein
MTEDEARHATADPGNVQMCGMRVSGGVAEAPTTDYGFARVATTPDVPRGHFWNHNGTLMVGYWDLLDAYTTLRAAAAAPSPPALPGTQ